MPLVECPVSVMEEEKEGAIGRISKGSTLCKVGRTSESGDRNGAVRTRYRRVRRKDRVQGD